MADQVTITDLERRAIAHYINQTQTKLAALRDAISIDLSANYTFDKRTNKPTYHRTYVEDIRAALTEIQSDFDKVTKRTLWGSEQ